MDHMNPVNAAALALVGWLLASPAMAMDDDKILFRSVRVRVDLEMLSGHINKS